MKYYFYHGKVNAPLHGNAAIFGVYSAVEEIDPAEALTTLARGIARELNVDAAAIEIDQFNAVAWTPPPAVDMLREDAPPSMLERFHKKGKK